MEKDKKLKVASVKDAQQPERQIAGFYIPANIMDQILGYIGQGPWLEVNDFIVTIRNNAQPVYPKVEEPKIDEIKN